VQCSVVKNTDFSIHIETEISVNLLRMNIVGVTGLEFWRGIAHTAHNFTHLLTPKVRAHKAASQYKIEFF